MNGPNAHTESYEGPATGRADGGPAKALLSPALYSAAVRGLIGALILALCLWLLSGIVELLIDIYHAVTGSWNARAEQMIINVLTMFALLELIRTLQSYLEIGRVRVTFILDAALVVLIGELIGLWYRAHTAQEVILSLAVITMLIILRIITVKFSPDAYD